MLLNLKSLIAPCFYAGFAVACVSLAQAPTASAGEVTWGLYIDNDSLAPNNDDAGFTGAGAIVAAAMEPDALPISADFLVSGLSDALTGAPTATSYETELGAAAFTPRDIEAQQPILNDRPFASLIYMTGKRHVQLSERHAATTSVTIGWLGSSLVGDFQDSLHEVLGARDPGGWDNQISDGGEPTVRLTHERKWLGGDHQLAGQRVQWLARASGSVGYLTGGHIGLTGRWGRFDSPWWRYHTAPTGFGDRTTPVPGARGEWFLFASATLGLRGYDAFLQGQFRDSAVTVDADDIDRMTPSLSIGAFHRFEFGPAIYYSVAVRETAVDFDEVDDYTFFGTITIYP